MTIKNRGGREFFPIHPFLTADYIRNGQETNVPVFYYVPHFFPSWNDGKEHLIIKPRVTDSDYTCYRNAHGSNKTTWVDNPISEGSRIRPIASNSSKIMNFYHEGAQNLQVVDQGSYYRLYISGSYSYKLKVYAIFASDDDFVGSEPSQMGFMTITDGEEVWAGLGQTIHRNVSQLYHVCYPDNNGYETWNGMNFTPPTIRRNAIQEPIYGQFYDWIIHIYEV